MIKNIFIFYMLFFPYISFASCPKTSGKDLTKEDIKSLGFRFLDISNSENLRHVLFDFPFVKNYGKKATISITGLKNNKKLWGISLQQQLNEKRNMIPIEYKNGDDVKIEISYYKRRLISEQNNNISHKAKCAIELKYNIKSVSEVSDIYRSTKQ
ncbi:hypothetical protein MNBD_GAMMA11-2024 [hydrothermal vent metagenome]|uniref:Lipoprotein n=1 Tax=hydrothermal vent metagenome TaxID=652676 RepID=A0A3B0XPM2_9ZZZZ